MKNRALMFAAPASGSGKTLITCGMLRLFKNMGLNPASFKCGPDYIDPMFHKTVIGIEASNIDLFFCGDKTAAYLFKENSRGFDISVAEGVMGYYDGMSASSVLASSYDVARTLGLPVIMVINSRGQSISSLAVLKGMSEFKKDSNVKGAIFNNMSEHVYESLKKEVKELTGVEPLGYLPKCSELSIESRHLGLVTPEEIDDLSGKLDRLAQIMEKTIDIGKLLEIASGYDFPYTEEISVCKIKKTPRIAVARDEAFCFYYRDNLSLLKKMGAEIVEFSPIHDKRLPEGTDALILGGGYPELYCTPLFSNRTMTEDIKKKLDGGMPCMAECGGFMYLHEEMEDMKGNVYKAVGHIQGKAFKTDSLRRFGYVNLMSQINSDLIRDGEIIKAHEFHYFDSDNCGNAFKAVKPVTGRSWECVNAGKNSIMGFPHLFYYSNTKVAERFIEAAVKYKEGDKEAWQKL